MARITTRPERQQLVVVMPAGLFLAAKSHALTEDRTLSNWVRRLIRQELAESGVSLDGIPGETERYEGRVGAA